MQGIRIFRHSVQQVFGNFGAALRISGLLALVQLGIAFVFGLQAIYGPLRGQILNGHTTYFLLEIGLVTVLTSILAFWIAVAWHRFILRGEANFNIIPKFHAARIWAYFYIGLLITFMMLFVAFIGSFAVTFILSMLLSGFDASEGLARAVNSLGIICFFTAATYVLFRCSPALPAAALGENEIMEQVWDKMSGKEGTLFVLALISTMSLIILDLGGTYLFEPEGWPSLIWGVVSKWIGFMVGISIMTTLYGHYLEDRPLV